MTETTRSFTVTPAMNVVIDYLKDFAHAESWDPGTLTCTREDTGPVAVGSSWHNVSKFAGRETELTYTLRSLEPDHLIFVGENKTATSTDDMSFEAVAEGTRITYTAHIDFHGAAKLAGPLFGPMFEKLGDKTQDQMIDVLNRLS